MTRYSRIFSPRNAPLRPSPQFTPDDDADVGDAIALGDAAAGALRTIAEARLRHLDLEIYRARRSRTGTLREIMDLRRQIADMQRFLGHAPDRRAAA